MASNALLEGIVPEKVSVGLAFVVGEGRESIFHF